MLTRIVVAVLDTQAVTVYKENGDSLVIPQGDPRVRRVVDAHPTILSQGYADVDLSSPDGQDTVYADFQAKSDGKVKLYRIAKDKIKHLYMDVNEWGEAQTFVVGNVSPQAAALEEIMAHAVPVTSEKFSEEGLHKQGDIEEDGRTDKSHPKWEEEDTIIAVTEDNKVIPGMENIKNQFAAANKLGSTIGVENFLKRLSAVIDKRSHSIQDLLKFMERGDLPIADDGTIVIYKVLNRKGDRTDGKYLDCHTGKVEQWTGAYVCMDERLVDHNRNNECSNGLHVARRGYINGFGGDVCVLAKLAPEDVIAVPTYDANKMRVCGYHIIAELTDAQYQLLRRNAPMTNDTDGKLLLANALAGNHIGRTHEVRITEQRGGGVQVKTYEERREAPRKEVKPVEALQNAPKPVKEADIDVTEVNTKVTQLSRGEKAKQLFAAYKNAEEGAEDALREFKRNAKVSWEKLGIPDPATVKPKKPKTRHIDVAKVAKIYQDNNMMEGSARERIAKLISIGLNSKGVAQTILTIKRQAKKSWEALGVKPSDVKKIEKLA